jgi:hypothetical protein
VSFDRVVSDVVQTVEAVGVAIMIVGGSWALVDHVASMTRGSERAGACKQLCAGDSARPFWWVSKS